LQLVFVNSPAVDTPIAHSFTVSAHTVAAAVFDNGLVLWWIWGGWFPFPKSDLVGEEILVNLIYAVLVWKSCTYKILECIEGGLLKRVREHFISTTVAADKLSVRRKRYS
jgi:hypothetical protein